LVVLAGPSGVGKGTIVAELVRRDPTIWCSVSATTRAPRPGERDGIDYWFMTRADFENVRDDGGFLEWFSVFGDLKGTPRGPVEEHLAAGRDVLLEIDVQGALAVKEASPGAVLIFIQPPSQAALEARLVGRGSDDPAQVARRLAGAAAEEALAPQFDAVVVNEDLEPTVERVEAILSNSRQTPREHDG